MKNRLTNRWYGNFTTLREIPTTQPLAEKVNTMKVATVIGTNHGIQRGENLKDDFKSYLIDLCEKSDIKAIAEEINDNADFVVAKYVCQDLGIDHKIIDPNPADYVELGIKKINVIEYEIMNIYDLESKPSTDNGTHSDALSEYESRIRNEHNHPREVEWLKRIQEHDKWPVLVICGSNHFDSFCSLLSGNGISVTFDESNWGG